MRTTPAPDSLGPLVGMAAWLGHCWEGGSQAQHGCVDRRAQAVGPGAPGCLSRRRTWWLGARVDHGSGRTARLLGTGAARGPYAVLGRLHGHVWRKAQTQAGNKYLSIPYGIFLRPTEAAATWVAAGAAGALPRRFFGSPFPATPIKANARQGNSADAEDLANGLVSLRRFYKWHCVL
jgi:hypothetical protein